MPSVDGLTGRAVRGAAFAVAASALGVTAHLLGATADTAHHTHGSVTPSLAAAVSASGALVLLAALFLSRRRRSSATLVGTLGVLQLVQHLLLALLVPELHGAAWPGPGMLLWHTLAATATGLMLCRGEDVVQLFLRLVAALAGLTRVPAPSHAVTPASVRLLPPASVAPVVRELVVLDGAPRRGPPVAAAAV